MEPDAEELRRLRWRCRRGLLEVDLILQGFACQGLEGLDAGAARALATLLEQPDPVLLEWLLGRVNPPPDLADVVRRIRAAAPA